MLAALDLVGVWLAAAAGEVDMFFFQRREDHHRTGSVVLPSLFKVVMVRSGTTDTIAKRVFRVRGGCRSRPESWFGCMEISIMQE